MGKLFYGRALEWGGGGGELEGLAKFCCFLPSALTWADLRMVRVTKRAEKIAYYDLVRVSAKMCLILSSFGLVQGISWWIEDIGQTSIRNLCLAPFVIVISVEKSLPPPPPHNLNNGES